VTKTELKAIEWPDGHIVNRATSSPTGAHSGYWLMLCGKFEIFAKGIATSGVPMEAYDLDEVPDGVGKGRPMCERCMEAAGL
jgi:hypothetical protein